MKKQPFTLHTIQDQSGDKPLKVILPADNSRGLIVGDDWEVQALHDLLGQYLATGKTDGEISNLDECLGLEWITTLDAVKLADVSERTVRYAASHGFIHQAEKSGRDWRFPKTSFITWLNHRPKPGRKNNV